MDYQYHVPKALTVLAGIFLAAGAIFLIIPIIDILNRRGWKSMMLIMIPVWPINASYLGPLTLYLYFKYGRPTKPEESHNQHPDSAAKPAHAPSSDEAQDHRDMEMGTSPHASHHMSPTHNVDNMTEMHDSRNSEKMHDMSAMHHMHGHSPDRPTWATVMIGVFHCGSGCVLGDLVGEWLVYGTGASINGSGLWICLLVDYAFALLFGIFFQYFSIAPMSGDYGPKSLVRAIKADFLSLTSFEIGLFSWMVVFQVGIWDYQVMTNTWLYWWMMQMGMVIGSLTAFPVNWWLITRKIKEPCA